MTAHGEPNQERSRPPCADVVVAVVVTFQPDLLALLAQIKALRSQVARMVIVDNGSTADLCSWCRSAAPQVDAVLRLEHNLGIGAAQNEGIAWARAHGASHVLLMDQDSEPEPGMVEELLGALQEHDGAGAAGPLHADPRQPIVHSPFVRLDGLRFRRLACAPGVVHAVDHLIASGCLIPLAVLDQVGVMRADWFIDFVDVEWSLRARAAGWQLLGVCSARMSHGLGGPPIVFMGRRFLAYPPWRHYFQVRNAVLLYRQSFVPRRWALASAWRLLMKIGFNCVAGRSRWQHLKATLRGLWHGATGRTGVL
ncbi:MAG: glycosyltransferase family 2 protein [Burkholderiaceae bacterium]|jgi:rhamnosyltransferase|nr:glycosyltransferase family 2 protein [Burkholderiaceae bacterium]MCO5103533.1 glycosyltransferase family 2 protein [Burkholderiaceae bacterium]